MPTDAPDFHKLRPFADLDPATESIVRAVYEHQKKTGEGIKPDHLQFEAKVAYEDVRQAQDKLGLLKHMGTGNTYRLSVLALLYLPEALPDLQALERLVAFAHTEYKPDKPRMEGEQVAQAIGIGRPDLMRLAPYFTDLGLSIATNTGDLFFNAENLTKATLAQALVHTFPRVRARHQDYLAQELQAPFRLRPLSLRLARFRALRDVSLDLGPLTVLVGTNGVGKSTVLDALTFIGRAARYGLGAALHGEAGLGRLRTFGDDRPLEIDLHFELDYGNEQRTRGRYFLEVGHLHDTVVLEREVLSVEEPDGKRMLIDGRRGRAVVLDRSQKPATIYLEASENALGNKEARTNPIIRYIAEALGRVVLIDRDPIHASGLGATYFYSPDGSHLAMSGDGRRHRATIEPAEILRPIAADPDLSEQLGRYLAELVPAFSGVHRHITPEQTADLEFQEKGNPGLLALDELSGGTRQLVLLAAQYLHPRPPTVLLVEEPDAIVHVGAQAALLDLLRSLAQKTAVVLTTHSPTFVGRLDPVREVRVLERAEQGVRARTLAEALESSAWLKAFGSPAEAFLRSALETKK